jgi:hypothetical protein
MIEFEHEQQQQPQSCKAPMYCNKYAMDDAEEFNPRRPPNIRSQSMPRQSRYGDRLMPPQSTSNMRDDNRNYDENDLEMQPRKGTRKASRPGMFVLFASRMNLISIIN